MNLYLIYQTENNDYDTYDSVVVASESESDARTINPDYRGFKARHSAWCSSPDKVNVKFLCSGYDGERGIVLASFNAG